MNLAARSIFLFVSQGFLSVMVANEILFTDTSVWYTYAES